MPRSSRPFLLIAGLILLVLILTGVWHLSQREREAQERQRFAEPVPSGMPNFLNATPAAPPPQP